MPAESGIRTVTGVAERLRAFPAVPPELAGLDLLPLPALTQDSVQEQEREGEAARDRHDTDASLRESVPALTPTLSAGDNAQPIFSTAEGAETKIGSPWARPIAYWWLQCW